MFVSNHLLGPKELNLYFLKNLLEGLLDFYETFLDNFCSIIEEKTGQIVFFSWKVCLSFSKNCVFNNLLGSKEKILRLQQYLSEYFVDPYKLFRELFHSR